MKNCQNLIIEMKDEMLKEEEEKKKPSINFRKFLAANQLKDALLSVSDFTPDSICGRSLVWQSGYKPSDKENENTFFPTSLIVVGWVYFTEIKKS